MDVLSPGSFSSCHMSEKWPRKRSWRSGWLLLPWQFTYLLALATLTVSILYCCPCLRQVALSHIVSYLLNRPNRQNGPNPIGEYLIQCSGGHHTYLNLRLKWQEQSLARWVAQTSVGTHSNLVLQNPTAPEKAKKHSISIALASEDTLESVKERRSRTSKSKGESKRTLHGTVTRHAVLHKFNNAAKLDLNCAAVNCKKSKYIVIHFPDSTSSNAPL